MRCQHNLRSVIKNKYTSRRCLCYLGILENIECRAALKYIYKHSSIFSKKAHCGKIILETSNETMEWKDNKNNFKNWLWWFIVGVAVLLKDFSFSHCVFFSPYSVTFLLGLLIALSICKNNFSVYLYHKCRSYSCYLFCSICFNVKERVLLLATLKVFYIVQFLVGLPY